MDVETGEPNSESYLYDDAAAIARVVRWNFWGTGRVDDREGATMQFQIRDANCPRCSKPVYVASIDRHPTRTDIAEHRYECEGCGPVVTGSLPLRAEPAELTGR
jgi:hypothetical protein